MNTKQQIASLICLGLLAFSCKQHQKPPVVKGIDVAQMDLSISPKEDFYNYVNGTWMKNTEIPNDRTSWGGFSVLRKKTDKDVMDIIDSSVGKHSTDTDQGKAMVLYQHYLDTVARNKAGIDPLKPVLESIATIKNVEDLQTVLAKKAAVIASPFMALGVFANLSDSKMNAAYIGLGGLGLPERDYYLDQDDKSKEIRNQYLAHVAKMLQLLGDDEESASQQAQTILAIETELAAAKLDKVQRRDLRNMNNPRTIEQLSKMTPVVNWKKYLADLGTPSLDTVIVSQLKGMDALQKVLSSYPIEDLKALVRWLTFKNASDKLTTTIAKANWSFYSKTLRGAKEQRPIKERALAFANAAMGEAIGQLYVAEKFPPQAKEKAKKMIANVIAAYKARIQKLDWMQEATKAKAIEKLNKFTVKIGYPDKWEDYSKMAIKQGDGFYQNMVAVARWLHEKQIAKINQPVDKSEWGMSPQTVNAYFHPMNNEIVFPAAILQPPFYNYQADEAVNYGGIGAVIGHEISHAFDDSGARFDADGNLNNWWEESDLKEFTKRGNALAKQYSAIEVLPGVFINGKFTLGENIGDLGGVLGAYDGLQRYLKEAGRPEKIDGFTPEQRFFISWATIWRTKMRPAALRTLVKTDPHSPGMYRAYVPLKNVDAFYEAFDIKEGDKMFLPIVDRVRIW